MRSLSFPLLVVLLLGALPCSARAACESSVGGDQRFIEAQLAELAALLPALPAGWREYERTTTPLVRQTHCRAGEAGPYPAPALVQLELTALPDGAPQLRIRALDARRAEETDRQRDEMSRATREVQEASRQGDLPALQKANADLQAATAHLQANQRLAIASVRTLDSLRQQPQPAALHVTLTVNPGTLAPCGGWTDEAASGAAFAGRFDAAPTCSVGPFVGKDVTAARVRGWGDWYRDGDTWLARFERSRAGHEVPLYARYTLWIVVRGDDAAAVRALTAALDAAVAAKQLEFAHTE